MCKKINNQLEIFWAIACLVLIIIEVSTSNMVTIWFAASSFVCIPFAYFNTPIITQICVFTALSIIFIVTFKPLTNRLIHPKENRTMIDKIGIVSESTDLKLGIGHAKFGDVEWMIKSKDDIPLKEGELVKVIDVKGVKLIVLQLHNEVH